MEDKSKKKKFWRGDPFKGAFYGMFIGGIFVGMMNSMLIHFPHLGLITWIAIFLIMGTQPRFKDKRTPEQIKADDAKFWDHVHEETRKDKEKKALKTQQPIVNNVTVKQEQPKEKYSRHAPKCPKCKSHNIQVLDNRRKAFSLGKAAVGGVLYGGIGTIAGFAGAKGKKYDAVFMYCGNKFKIKL
ncbi:hypothetical protein [Liquorilactobacillus nagelii]|uniref:hypothetical protein n=1 Tax=Liquorilactobacillus nagelii TaxID=82688 RepID=UPI0039ECAF68